MAKIPNFKSQKEEREFWDSHDSTGYWDHTEEVQPFALSDRIAKAMIEAQKIARGEIKGKDARALLKEIEKE